MIINKGMWTSSKPFRKCEIDRVVPKTNTEHFYKYPGNKFINGGQKVSCVKTLNRNELASVLYWHGILQVVSFELCNFPFSVNLINYQCQYQCKVLNDGPYCN